MISLLGGGVHVLPVVPLDTLPALPPSFVPPLGSLPPLVPPLGSPPSLGDDTPPSPAPTIASGSSPASPPAPTATSRACMSPQMRSQAAIPATNRQQTTIRLTGRLLRRWQTRATPARSNPAARPVHCNRSDRPRSVFFEPRARSRRALESLGRARIRFARSAQAPKRRRWHRRPS